MSFYLTTINKVICIYMCGVVECEPNTGCHLLVMYTLRKIFYWNLIFPLKKRFDKNNNMLFSTFNDQISWYKVMQVLFTIKIGSISLQLSRNTINILLYIARMLIHFHCSMKYNIISHSNSTISYLRIKHGNTLCLTVWVYDLISM